MRTKLAFGAFLAFVAVTLAVAACGEMCEQLVCQ